MRFFCGLHQPSDVRHVSAPAFVSVTRLSGQKGRKSPFTSGDWIMDSGAFTTIARHGGYPEPVEAYAEHIRRWSSCGNLLASVAQDYMCEPEMLAKTKAAGYTDGTVAEHQRLTIERYDALLACRLPVYLMPVLQGYTPAEYVEHLRMYGGSEPGGRLGIARWVGVGSVCKRNGDPRAIEAVLLAIKRARPDLRLHGFGLKKTALGSSLVWELLDTADSMAWSYAARAQGRNGNDRREADAYVAALTDKPRQLELVGAA